jgi:uncharacterized membrane protein YhaH (DUF805 family)
MRKYYYSNGVDRVGPVSLAELITSGELRSETLVWYEGLPSWVRADALPELCDVVSSPLPSEGKEFKLLSLLFSFSGRLSRLQYFISGIVTHIVLIIALQIVTYGEYLIALSIIIALGTWIHYALGVKRCHDIGWSGWWQLLPLLLTMLAAWNGEIEEPGSFFKELKEMSGAAEFFAFIVWWLVPGDKGSNRYGLDPKVESDKTSPSSLPPPSPDGLSPSKECHEGLKRDRLNIIAMVVVALIILIFLFAVTGCLDWLFREPESWERYL